MRKGIVIGAVVILVVAWFLFRPEKLFINENVNEDFPSQSAEQSDNTPQAFLEGDFHGVAHETKGTATIYKLPEGNYVLRLTDFETSNGPDVRVYLGRADDANDSETVKSVGYTELGPLKGNLGDQNYEIPSGTDIGAYHSVTIWCARFGVNFGTAPLTAKN